MSMKVLPNELLECIFHQLCPGDYSSALAVSKKWNHLMICYIEKSRRNGYFRATPIQSISIYNLPGYNYDWIGVDLKYYENPGKTELAPFRLNPTPTPVTKIVRENAMRKLLRKIFCYLPKQLELKVDRVQSQDLCIRLPKWWLDGIEQIRIESPRPFETAPLISRMVDVDTYEGHIAENMIESMESMHQVQSYRSYSQKINTENSILHLLSEKSKNSSGLREFAFYGTNHCETFCDLDRFLKEAHFASECRLRITKLYGCDNAFFSWIQQNATRVERCNFWSSYRRPSQIRISFAYRKTEFTLEIGDFVPFTYFNFALRNVEHSGIFKRYSRFKTLRLMEKYGIEVVESRQRWDF